MYHIGNYHQGKNATYRMTGIIVNYVADKGLMSKVHKVHKVLNWAKENK